jgi:hypothetical protein
LATSFVDDVPTKRFSAGAIRRPQFNGRNAVRSHHQVLKSGETEVGDLVLMPAKVENMLRAVEGGEEPFLFQASKSLQCVAESLCFAFGFRIAEV